MQQLECDSSAFRAALVESSLLFCFGDQERLCIYMFI